MFQIHRPALRALVGATLLAACGGSAESADPPEGTSEVPVAEAPAQAADAPAEAAAPQPSSSAPATTPKRRAASAAPSQPAAATPAEAPAIPASTTLTLALDQALSTKSNKAGDPFSAHLIADLMAPGGEILLPMGTVVRGEVTEAVASPSADVPAMLRLQIVSVEVNGEAVPVVADVEDLQLQTEAKDSDRQTAGKVAVGAAAGALLGKITGKGTTKGAVVGAAAGAAVAIATRDGNASLPVGSQMTIRLLEPLVLR